MVKITILITLIIFLFSIYFFFKENHGYIPIIIENKTYNVIKYDNYNISKKNAEFLHEIFLKIEKLLNHLKKSKDFSIKKKEINRLLTKYKGSLKEIHSDHKSIGLNINKGSVIGVCLYDDKIQQNFNTAIFVVLHELAHCMTKEYKHNDEFWSNFKFLIKQAMKSGVYKYENFIKNPKYYCDTKISYTPYQINL